MRRRTTACAWLVLATLSSVGCVERRFTVTSDPPGAVVQVNGRPVGATPVDVPFIYYGDYNITLLKDGYETMQVRQNVPAPFYQYPPLDFVSEHVYPGHIEDARRFHYTMQPLAQPRTDVLLEQAQQLRQRAAGLPGDPPPPPPVMAVPPSSPPAAAPPPRLLLPEPTP